jgi:hypothetical protein
MVFKQYDPLASLFCFHDIIPPSDEFASAFFVVHLYKHNMNYLNEIFIVGLIRVYISENAKMKHELPVWTLSDEVWPASRSMEDNERSRFVRGGKNTWHS